MKKIRQRNDIDVVVQLKNNEGMALDPTLCSDMTVYLTCGTKKFYINNLEKHADGRIKFRFLAEQQTKLGIHNVTISAVTEDGRTFTTDACNAFNLVACSCNAGDDAGEVNVESVEVDATFEISAWGMVSDIVTYEIPSDWAEVGKQHEITQDNFHAIFGSEEELLKNFENKHVRLKMLGDVGYGMQIIDVATSMFVKIPDETSTIYIIDFNGNASADTERFAIVYALDVRCGIVIGKNADGTYSFIEGSFEIIQKENSVTTEEIADEAVTTDKIANNAVTTDKIANKAITLDKIADGVLSSLGSFIDKGTLDEYQIRSLCEYPETGIFSFIDRERRLNCLLFKPYQPSDDYRFMCITEKEYGELKIEVRGGDGLGHGGWENFVDTTIKQDSTKPISSGAVYNAIYSVLNTEV